MQRFLILSCTERKRHDQELLPAVERYDGPSFRLLRRFRKQTTESIEVYILSAQFGLIHCEEPIPYYDQMMTPQRSTELKPQISERFQQIFGSAHHGNRKRSQLLFCMGKLYFNVLKESMPTGILVEHAPGPIGKQLSKLHQWLYRHQSRLEIGGPTNSARGNTRLRGIDIAMTPAGVINRARRQLSQQSVGAENYQSWYVSIDGKRVSPKWLVSLLTGLPVSKFHSDEARRILQRLGVEVHRVRL
jgi:hypothetical protein